MPECIHGDILTVTTTVASSSDAQRLARELLARRLAACVQVESGVTSFYRWKGEVCEDAELRLVIKTLPACEPALLAFFAQEHPYELPQYTATRMTASDAYAAWVRSELGVSGCAAADDPRPG